MIFTTWVFVFFFLAVWLGYLRLSKSGQNWLLLAASYVFYSFWDYRFLALIIISTLANFYAAGAMARTDSRTKRVRWLTLCLIANLSLLGFFKYFDFFAQSLVSLGRGLGLEIPIPVLNIVLPMGISFYTFQALGYTIDVFRNQVKPCGNLRDFALFVAFFPQLVAGPIERASNLLTQIVQPRLLSWSAVRQGLWLLLQGFFLKLYVADNAAVIANKVFAMDQPTGAIAILGVYAFALQIYGDFCGYSRIARGLARVMGFELMVNFRQPYFAQSPSDFWQRWHISLSTWLRDYLYIPLGGNRQGSGRLVMSLVVTMFLGGLWHGAAWKFVIWGLYHGGLLVVFRFLPGFSGEDQESGGLIRVLKAMVIFHLVCFGWLIFRCNSLEQIVYFPWAILNNFAWGPGAAQTLYGLLCLALPVLVMDLLCENAEVLRIRTRGLRRATGSWWALPKYAAWVLASSLILALIFLFGARGGKEFIYFQF